MSKLRSLIDALTAICKWLSCMAAGLMVLVITVVVVGRAIHRPLAADVEIIQLTMGVMVMMGLAFTERSDGHVTVGLIVDHFSASWQAALDTVAVLLTFAVCAAIGWVNLVTAAEFLTVHTRTSDYLSIPFWPFKIVVGLGFWLWGLQALLKLPQIAYRARHGIKSTAAEGHV